MKLTLALARTALALAAFACPSAAFPSAARAAAPGGRTSGRPAAPARAQSAAPVESVYPFELRSGFWINLHHFLYEQALLRRRGARPGQPADAASSPKSQLTREQQASWDAALDYYARELVKRDLLRDEGMVIMNDRLGEAGGAPDLSKSGLGAELIKVLEGVAPVYREQWWPRHDSANRFWIAVATPLVRQFGRTFVAQLSAAYKAKWPSGPVRVDVVEYANWAGAYTTTDGEDVHVTVSSVERDNQGFSALETLFHEASHALVGPNDGAVARAIARESKARKKPVPDGLWHALMFYTVGEVTRRNLREYGVSDYTPFGYRGLYERAWPKLLRPLELHWQPYLEGKVDFDKAVSNIIDAL